MLTFINRTVLCSFALVLLYPLGIDLYLVGLPQIALSLNASEPELHHAFSLYLFGMVLSMSLGGAAADRLGRKPIAILGIVLFAIASFLAMTATQAHGFLLARIAQGVGAGLPYVVAFAILRDTLNDEKRAKVLTIVNGIICILPVLAPVIGHFILQQFDWPWLFAVMLIAAGFIALLVLFLLKETLGKRQCEAHSNREESLSLKTQSEVNRVDSNPFLSPLFLSRLVIGALNVAVILTYVNISPILMMEQLGMETGAYSSVMSSTAMVSMLAAFTTPKLINRLGQEKVITLAQSLFLLSALSLLLAFQYGQDLTLYYFAFAALCISFSIGFGVITSQALAPFSNHAALASSLLATSQIAFSALYIGACAWLNVGALNMLLGVLLAAGVLGIVLIIKIDSKQEPAGQLGALT